MTLHLEQLHCFFLEGQEYIDGYIYLVFIELLQCLRFHLLDGIDLASWYVLRLVYLRVLLPYKSIQRKSSFFAYQIREGQFF